MCILIQVLTVYINISKIFRNNFLSLFICLGLCGSLLLCGLPLMVKAGPGLLIAVFSVVEHGLQWLQHVGSVGSWSSGAQAK